MGLEDKKRTQTRSTNDEEDYYYGVLCAVAGMKDFMEEMVMGIERNKNNIVLVGNIVSSASATIEALSAKMSGGVLTRVSPPHHLEVPMKLQWLLHNCDVVPRSEIRRPSLLPQKPVAILNSRKTTKRIPKPSHSVQNLL